MPAYLHFDPLTNSTIAFATKEAFNSWFASIYIEDATTLSAGPVLKAQAISYSVIAYDNEDIVQFPIGGDIVSLPTQAHMEAVKTKLNALEAAFDALHQKLVDAGIMTA